MVVRFKIILDVMVMVRIRVRVRVSFSFKVRVEIRILTLILTVDILPLVTFYVKSQRFLPKRHQITFLIFQPQSSHGHLVSVVTFYCRPWASGKVNAILVFAKTVVVPFSFRHFGHFILRVRHTRCTFNTVTRRLPKISIFLSYSGIRSTRMSNSERSKFWWKEGNWEERIFFDGESKSITGRFLYKDYMVCTYCNFNSRKQIYKKSMKMPIYIYSNHFQTIQKQN